MIPGPILQTLIKYGILGPVLVWALMENSKTTAKLFSVIEANTKALTQLSNIIHPGCCND